VGRNRQREQLKEVKLSWSAVENGISERHIRFQAGVWIVSYIQETASEVFVAGLHLGVVFWQFSCIVMLIKTG
jgi:hypothetical protein